MGTSQLGLWQYPSVLEALNPYRGVKFFVTNGSLGFLVLGAVVLAITGAEALYTDMGQFGERPIRLLLLALLSAWALFRAKR